MEYRRCPKYRCAASSIEGLVQQIAVTYLRHGYFYYVTGTLKAQHAVEAVDASILEKYNIRKCWRHRAEQKLRGYANMQYIRHGIFYVLMATEGEHRFKQREWRKLRDIRDPKSPLLVPISTEPCRYVTKKPKKYRDDPRVFEGYEISYRRGRYQRKTTEERAEYRKAVEDWKHHQLAGMKSSRPAKGKEKVMWHATVSIEARSCERLRSCFLSYATRWKRGRLEMEFRAVPYEPYWMVKRQLFSILCEVNERRKTSGRDQLPGKLVHKMKRQQVFPFRHASGDDRRAA